MKRITSKHLYIVVICIISVLSNAQVSNQLRDSISKLIMKKIVYVGINKKVQYEKVYEGNPFYEERVIEKNKLLDTIFIRNDSLITKYKEDRHDWIYYEGKKHKNLYDPPGYLSAAMIDLKLSIVYINQGNWEGAPPGGYTNIILVETKNKSLTTKEFPYRSLNFIGHEFNGRFTNKNAKELNEANSIISLLNAYILQIYKGKLEAFKTKANQVNNNLSISEEQRKLIVQANLANEEKKYEKALELYEKSMQLNEFNYPQGYYNMSLIASQLEDYPLAIFNMKKYLILSPNAEDNRKTQDKIYEWEFKLENK